MCSLTATCGDETESSLRPKVLKLHVALYPPLHSPLRGVMDRQDELNVLYSPCKSDAPCSRCQPVILTPPCYRVHSHRRSRCDTLGHVACSALGTLLMIYQVHADRNEYQCVCKPALSARPCWSAAGLQSAGGAPPPAIPASLRPYTSEQSTSKSCGLSAHHVNAKKVCFAQTGLVSMHQSGFCGAHSSHMQSGTSMCGWQSGPAAEHFLEVASPAVVVRPGTDPGLLEHLDGGAVLRHHAPMDRRESEPANSMRAGPVMLCTRTASGRLCTVNLDDAWTGVICVAQAEG